MYCSKIRTALIVFLVSLVSVHVTGATYYVSPTGISTAAGTIANPLSFSTAIAKALVAGDSIIVRGGTYTFSSMQTISKSGSSAKFIHIIAYAAETPVLDFRTQAYNSSNQGVKVSGSYVHVKGLTVQGAGDNGMQVTGSYNTIENCTFRWNCDSGLQMKTGSSNLILNCDSYANFDYESGGIAAPDFGGNADGFADKQYTNAGTNTYKGCRSWGNSDDAWDSFEKIGNTVYDSCWSYANGPTSYDMTDHIRFKTDSATWFYQFKNALGRYIITNYGNGNGFKVGGNYTANNATLRNCVAVGDKVKGFDQNNNNGIMTLYNCTAYNNQYNYGFSNSSYGTLIIKNCASLNSIKSNSFNSNSVTQSNNSWNTGFACVAADFVSLDYAQLLNARSADGSLPEITFLHQKASSGMIDKGLDLGYTYSGTAPDLGAFEYSLFLADPVVKSDKDVVYYSAIGNKIVLKGDVENVDIYNMIGKKVYSASKLTANSEISTVRWTEGVFIVVVNSGSKQSFSKKLLLQ